MHRLLTFALIAAFFPVLLYAQGWVGHLSTVSGAPTGACPPGEIDLDTPDQALYACPDAGTWPATPTLQGNTIQPGQIILLTSGTCAAGWTEVSALNGVFLQGTIAANGDVGTSGGHATITPTGTVSTPTFTGSAGTVPAETFTGSALGTHTHTVTPTGTNAATATTGNCAATQAKGTSTSSACSSTAPNLTVPAETFTGTQDTSSAVSAGTPAGTNGTVSFTPAGTVSQPSFTGNAIDPRPAFLKVIFCSKN